ncbi:LysR substrate-binding domain-containing protein, partial [Roseomonas sp. DSM 102946]|nr:LysR substrate-binding domain-containing protein [Roseomonas sp. DSM 102946]
GLRDIEEQIARIASGELDSITLAAMPVIATTMLPDVVAELTAEFPGTAIDLQSAHSTHIIPRVRGGSYALGIVSLRQPTVGVRVLWRDSFPYYCLLPPDDPLAEREVIQPADIAGRRLIGYAETAMSGIMLDRALSGIAPPPIIRLRVHLSKSTWALVEKGCGIAIVDTFAAHVHRSRGGIVRKFATDTRFDLTLIVREGGAPDAYVDRFVETLKVIGERYKGDRLP